MHLRSPPLAVAGLGSTLTDSRDRATYDPNLSDPIYNPDPNSGIPTHLKIGPSFFDLFANFPEAKYVIDIPMYHDNLSNSILFAEAANKRIGASNIYAWEIGNEPDNYGNTGADWNEKQFSEKWGNWSKAISKALNASLDSQTYQAVPLSSQTGVTGTPGGDADSWKMYVLSLMAFQGDTYQKKIQRGDF
ncbi:unnamed protein product [Aspergillus oryzae]|uniref:Unnamed protein product n=1 Tax=Aspergillus oryzae var. brunneus TaxID=332754 RepID=A0ABQ6KFS6_ASPOZ|nr:unnamed protein product [Aspergillus oryzae]GMF83969.1 unnamed protein product [Aspergillus oryzae]GMG01437.1 unnamed protein product [Aspergillus oryzae]GMG42563.1 unnamed protein product [Aspergillus oryzae var. brunneus]